MFALIEGCCGLKAMYDGRGFGGVGRMMTKMATSRYGNMVNEVRLSVKKCSFSVTEASHLTLEIKK